MTTDGFDPWAALPDAPLPEIQEKRVRAGVAAQGFTAHLGAELTALGSGRCRIEIAARLELMQNHGVFHGGVIGYLIVRYIQDRPNPGNGGAVSPEPDAGKV